MNTGIAVKSNRFERIWLLAKIEFKLRYYENKLGLIWAVLKPVFEMLIFYVAFEFLLGMKIPNYVCYIYLGIITWNFFVESSTGMIPILNTKKYLYEYSNISKFEIYIAHLLSIGIGFCFNLIIFAVYFMLTGNGFSINVLFYPILLLNLFLLGLGIAMILSTLYLVAKDINQIWAIVMAMGFWLSPILFKANELRAKLPLVDYFNPASGLIINTRKVLMEGSAPDFNLMLINLAQAALLILAGALLVRKIGIKASELL